MYHSWFIWAQVSTVDTERRAEDSIAGALTLGWGGRMIKKNAGSQNPEHFEQ